MSHKRCLYCYKALHENAIGDFHEQCSLDFFGTKQQPLFKHSLEQMAELAKNVVEKSVAVPFVDFIMCDLQYCTQKVSLKKEDR